MTEPDFGNSSIGTENGETRYRIPWLLLFEEGSGRFFLCRSNFAFLHLVTHFHLSRTAP